MTAKDRAVVFVRENLSASRATEVSELYRQGREVPNSLGESSIRQAVWQLVSRGEVSIDGDMRLRSQTHYER